MRLMGLYYKREPVLVGFLIAKPMFNFIYIIIINAQQISWFSKSMGHQPSTYYSL
jgi:hypothetical protein